MINSLPSTVQVFNDRIAAAIEHWPVKITMDNALKWVLQFDSDDYSLAVRVIENIDVIGSSQIRSALEVAHAKLVRKIAEKGSPVKGNNTLYAGIGNSAKSGALIAYHYRIAAEIPEEDFLSGDDEQKLDLSKVENIVLVDDMVGTGKTIAREVKRIAEEVYTLSRSRNIFVLTVAGYEDGIQHVIDETGASVVCALEYSVKDTVTNLDASFYDGLPMTERSVAQERLKRYCRSISSSELGFGGVGGLLVFDHNTPNTTLPIIWNSGKGWSPLFHRATRIPGVAKVLKSAQDERSQLVADKDPTGQQPQRQNSDLTLFVEGKVDEIFVDYMRHKRELANRINVREINAVALGGLYQSERLLGLLGETRKESIFVLDDDENTRRASSRMDKLKDMHILKLKPNFVAMLNIEKLYSDRVRFPDLPEQIDTASDSKWLHEVELAVLRRGPVSANSERIAQIIDEYLDDNKYEEFCTELRGLADKIFGPGTRAVGQA